MTQSELGRRSAIVGVDCLRGVARFLVYWGVFGTRGGLMGADFFR